MRRHLTNNCFNSRPRPSPNPNPNSSLALQHRPPPRPQSKWQAEPALGTPGDGGVHGCRGCHNKCVSQQLRIPMTACPKKCVSQQMRVPAKTQTQPGLVSLGPTLRWTNSVPPSTLWRTARYRARGLPSRRLYPSIRTSLLLCDALSSLALTSWWTAGCDRGFWRPRSRTSPRTSPQNMDLNRSLLCPAR